MVQSDMSKSPPSPAQEVQMELLDNPLPAAAAAAQDFAFAKLRISFNLAVHHGRYLGSCLSIDFGQTCHHLAEE
ncbi:voltage-dependent L-type calcium channel subunit beta-2 [Grus japonensis]|uniref:Voltage-dependent L-type calcium channel subunit beta-2 n=1 Tax=Grus japonensis TaxID=30415 RepID=A0ABC9WHN9_GRUJA